MAMEPKLIYLARRHPDLTREGFTARWRRHGALGMSMPRWANIRRYAHCDVIPAAIAGLDDSYDGVGLIWHRSPEARARHRADRHAQPQMEADEAHTFAEPVANFCLLAEEKLIKEGPSGPVKLFRFVSRANNLSKSDFEAAWRETGSRAAMQSEFVQRYVQNHTLTPEGPKGWGLKADCVDEFWFAHDQALRMACATLMEDEDQRRLAVTSIWVATNEVVLHDIPDAAGN